MNIQHVKEGTFTCEINYRTPKLLYTLLDVGAAWVVEHRVREPMAVLRKMNI